MSNVTVKGHSLYEIATDIKEDIEQELGHRTYLAANELRNAAMLVLRGQRSGRRYKVPGTHRLQMDKVSGKKKHGRYYTASAPGEPPAVRTGTFRNSWQPETHVAFGTYIARISSDARTDNGQHVLGEILEKGTSRMAPRPHHDRILEKAEPQIVKILEQPYTNE